MREVALAVAGIRKLKDSTSKQKKRNFCISIKSHLLYTKTSAINAFNAINRITVRADLSCF